MLHNQAITGCQNLRFAAVLASGDGGRSGLAFRREPLRPCVRARGFKLCASENAPFHGRMCDAFGYAGVSSLEIVRMTRDSSKRR